MFPDPNDDPARSPAANIQRDILAGRPYSLAEAIGREGGAFLKGESLVPQGTQAIKAILVFIDQALVDSQGALQLTLHRWVEAENVRISRHLETPLAALREMLEETLASPTLLYELVRQVDVRWGQLYGERPYFQRPGHPPHPDDEYTHESVQQQLEALLLQTLQVLDGGLPSQG